MKMVRNQGIPPFLPYLLLPVSSQNGKAEEILKSCQQKQV